MISSEELVALVISRVGATGETGDTDLARMLNLGVNGRDRVKRWREGKNSPDYAATIALLRLIGALNEDALRPRPQELVRRAEGLQQRTRRARRQLGREADE